MVEGGGGPDGGGARRERQLQKLQDKSNRYAEKALVHMRAGRGEKALAPNQRSIDIITRLRAEEPDNEQHLAQLAGKLYNHAGMLAQAGRITEAAAAARRSFDCYVELTGGEVTPEALTTHQLLGLGHSLRPTAARPDLLKQAAMTADAKCRFASLLARLPEAGAETGARARQLALEASDTYQHLAQLNIRYQADRMRVLSEYLGIVETTNQKA